MARLEAYEIKSKIRNDKFRQAIQSGLDGDPSKSDNIGLSAGLARGKLQLRDAKVAFIKELKRRDPNWTELLANRRSQDIERMEFDN